MFPKLTKISIVGISSVGKTTLIENLCGNLNTNVLTRGKNAYILNFSNNSNKYAALLDASGQSQSSQNDIAIDSHFIIVLLDHNPKDNDSEIDEERINKHSLFLDLLKDRIINSSHSIKWVHILLNKKDLWKGAVHEKNLIQLISTQIKLFDSYNNSIEITDEYHSNSFTQDVIKLKSEIAKRL